MIKGWYTKHEDTWHQIEDVKDTGKPAHEKGGGNVVKLKGKDKWVHASKLSGMEPKIPMEKTMEKKYHIYKDGQQITANGEEMTLKDIESKHGVKNLNNSGHLIKPVEPIKTNMSKADKIPGGLAAGKSPKDFDKKKLAQGIKVEMEHTSDESVAREIAMDHLTEDPEYYVKLKGIEKYDRVDEKADGKRELDYGKEELNKKWKKLRKAVLDSASAIMPIEEQEFQDEDNDEETEDGQVSAQSADDIPDQDQAAPPEEEVQDDGLQGDEQQGKPDPEEIEQMLRDEGYSDAEIAHIIHGHIMPEATVDDIKMGAEKEMSDHELDHKKRMNDLDYELASSEHDTNELDKDHKQRLLDLEYEYAKKEKELEFEYKKKELDFKLENQKQKAAAKIKETADTKDIGKSRRMDAAKTSKDEREGK